VDTSENSQPQRRRRRRTHSAEFKAQVVAACRTPGVSSAAVALEHRLNANLLRRWVTEDERAREAGLIAASNGSVGADAAFAAVELAKPAVAPVLSNNSNELRSTLRR
jgi:transposase